MCGEIPNTQEGIFGGGDEERWEKLSTKENKEHFSLHCVVM